MSDVVINGHADACVCCGTLEPATLSCRIRGGTATLCGYSEFTSPSTPPKKYRTKTYSGGWNTEFYNGPGCTNFRTSDLAVYYGTRVYNVDNCAVTNSAFEDYETGGCNNDPSETTLPAPETWSTGAGGVFDVINTPTTSTQDPTGICQSTAVCGGTNRIAYGAGAVQTLTVEDTNDDAIDRLLAGAGGTWGSWIEQGATGCTGTPPSCCLARYEERVSDFDFIYQESQFRVTATGLAPSTPYNARVEIYRRPYGSGSYVLYQTIIVSDTTDGSGNFSADGDVPNDEGFESYAANANIVIPS